MVFLLRNSSYTAYQGENLRSEFTNVSMEESWLRTGVGTSTLGYSKVQVDKALVK